MVIPIVADIEVILKRIKDVYPSPAKLSWEEWVVLKTKLRSFQPKLRLSEHLDPVCKKRFDDAEKWHQHLKAVVEANELLLPKEPTKAKSELKATNKGGRPEESTADDDAELDKLNREREPGLSKRQFAEALGIPEHELNLALKRHDSRMRRKRAKQ